MLVYKLQLTGDKKVYWLTEKRAKPIIHKWDSGHSGTLALPEYGLLTTLSRIREIRKMEESEPYPPEFKRMLAEEGALALPAPLTAEMERIMKLPVSHLVLGEDLQPLAQSEVALRRAWREQKPNALKTYYLATAHYDIHDGQECYYLKPEQIKRLLKMTFHDGEDKIYPASVVEVKSYGALV